jgi:hypothetical protein
MEEWERRNGVMEDECRRNRGIEGEESRSGLE